MSAPRASIQVSHTIPRDAGDLSAGGISVINTNGGKEKLKALELAVSQIEKQFGRGSIMKLGEQSATIDIGSIPTGSLALDIALGIGGVPRGRVIEIYGPES